MRIVSLLPSATEIVTALGLGDRLVGRSHECDYPSYITHLPACTQPKFDPEGTSAEIHSRVTNLLQTALSVYRVDEEQLKQLQPTHLITQSQCEVCAVSLADVEVAAANFLGQKPKIISLQPNLLEDVWADIRRVANCLQVSDRGREVVEQLQERARQCQAQCQSGARSPASNPRPMVGCIEWTDPLMAAGNWIPELVAMAGGEPLFALPGKHSPWLSWKTLAQADPEVLIFMPCGFDLMRTRQEAVQFLQQPAAKQLSAVRSGSVYVADGNAFFNRPGPRLVESLEILAEILHPGLCNFGHQGVGWERCEL